MRLVVVLLLCGVAVAADSPTTVPARVGSERYVRAIYKRGNERIAIRGHIKVLEVAPGGDERRGSLTVDECWRSVAGDRVELVPAGTTLLIKRSAGKNEFFYEDERPLEEEKFKWIRYVSGLRGGDDDLDFWDGTQVNEQRLRKIIANADFEIASVESQVLMDGDLEIARLRIPKMAGKPNGSFANGTFDVECRWRVNERGLERFRHTHWVLRDRGDEAKTREVEIIGIEAHTAADADRVYAEWAGEDGR